MDPCVARQLAPVAVPTSGALRWGGTATRQVLPPHPAAARARVATLGGAGRTHRRRVATAAELSPSGGTPGPEPEPVAAPRVADVYDTPPELLREGLRRHTVRPGLGWRLRCVWL